MEALLPRRLPIFEEKFVPTGIDDMPDAFEARYETITLFQVASTDLTRLGVVVDLRKVQRFAVITPYNRFHRFVFSGEGGELFDGAVA